MTFWTVLPTAMLIAMANAIRTSVGVVNCAMLNQPRRSMLPPPVARGVERTPLACHAAVVGCQPSQPIDEQAEEGVGPAVDGDVEVRRALRQAAPVGDGHPVGGSGPGLHVDEHRPRRDERPVE